MAKKANGEGSVYYWEEKKTWVAKITKGRDDNGKLIRITRYGKTKREVLEKIAKDKVAPTAIKSNLTFKEIALKILDSKLNANKIKIVSYKRGIETLNIISNSTFYDKQINKITSEEIQSFMNSVTSYSKSVIEKIKIQINMVFNFAINEQIVYINPFKKVILPNSEKIEKNVEAFSIEEQKVFVSSLDNEKYKNIFLLLLYTGMRSGELLCITLDDIDIKNNCIIVNKTLTKDKNDKYIIGNSTKTYNSIRKIPITSLIKPILDDSMINYIPNDKKFLFSQNNTFIEPNSVRSQFKRICKDCKILEKVYPTKRIKNGKEIIINVKSSEAHLHILRHTYATRCIEAGVSAPVLQKLLGHKDIQTTINTYTSIFDKYKLDELEKLEKYLGCTTVALL